LKFRWVGKTAHIELKGSEYWVLPGNPEGKRPIGRPRLYGRITDIEDAG
jgi:hypothetical protein